MTKLLFIFLIFVAIYDSAFGKSNKKKFQKPVYKGRNSIYIPQKVNWKNLINECRVSFANEKRLANFYIRAAAHDALSIVDGFGGADGSLLLTLDELKRPENNYDTFGFIVSKNALELAKKFDASVADIIAVCGAIASEFLGGPNIISTGDPIFVGRMDSYIPNPGHTLAPKNMNTLNFSQFAKYRNFTIAEMTALMGSHVLLDEQGCRKTENGNLQLFTWDNTYYRDVCSLPWKIEVGNTLPSIDGVGKGTRIKSQVPLPLFKTIKQKELCKFTSDFYQQRALNELAFDLDLGDTVQDNDIIHGEEFELEDVSFFLPSRGKIKPMYKKWIYTIHDAWMGKACNGDLSKENYNLEIQKWMNTFRKNSKEWNLIYSLAYKKMINLGVSWSKHGKIILNA
jgi:hypothetical protein